MKPAIVTSDEDPLWSIMIRVFGEDDRRVVDHIVARLLDRLDAKAFDTVAESLIFSPAL